MMCTACLPWPYLFQRPPDVSPMGEGVEVNKFEQVPSGDHQISLVSWGWGRGAQKSHVQGGQGQGCPVQ